MLQVFADIIRARHETLWGIVEGAKWPAVFVHRPPNCKNGSFLHKLTAQCVRAVGRRRDTSVRSGCLNLGVLACTPMTTGSI